MSVELIRYAYVTGELAPTLVNRTDLEKYDLGLALCYNWLVDYRGGISNRPGQEFCDFIWQDDKETRFERFNFNADISNTYLVLFGHEYIRFIQDGAYVLETAVNITAVTQATPGVVTATAHGFATGEWVKIAGAGGMTQLNSRTFRVGTTAANTFQLTDPLTNGNIDTTGYTAYTSGGTVSRIYTVVSPYDSDDLAALKATQIRDTLRLTHVDYEPQDLVRNDHADWDLADTEFGSAVPAPALVSATPQSAGTYGLSWTVTAVNLEGEESQPSDIGVVGGSTNFTTVAGGMRYKWTASAGAVKYNLYRSLVIDDNQASKGMQLGYIATVQGTVFKESNIIPDFTLSPPLGTNPFKGGAIQRIEIVAPGSGYTGNFPGPTVSVSGFGGSGSGFVGYVILDNDADTCVAVGIISGGEGYIEPIAVTINANGSGGTLATAQVTDVTPIDGNNPALSAVFQQRQLYAASTNEPLTVYGSKPGRFNNFDVGSVVVDNDSYSFEEDAEDMTPIRHMIPVRGGILLMRQTGIELLSGGGVNQPITPTQAQAEPQSYGGVARVTPLKIETDIMYLEARADIVRLLAYNEISKIYGGQDISILSNHFFGPGENEVTEWTYASAPHKVAWARRADGRLLSLTVVKEQNVFAWAQHGTQGAYKNVISVNEGGTDAVYFRVDRTINGRTTGFIERQVPRRFTDAEDSFFVDCGLRLAQTYPNFAISVSATTGSVTVTGNGTFVSGDAGKIIRVNGGKLRVDTYVDATHLTCTVLRDLTDVVPETGDVTGTGTTPLGADSGEWSMDTPVTAISGLWHLEGETVKVLADGKVHEDRVVTAGAITLAYAATCVVIGLGYRSIAQTLPSVVPSQTAEHKRKRVVGVAVRLHESRGLKSGENLDHLYELKERTTEAWDEPTKLQYGLQYQLLEPRWDTEGRTYFVQEFPLPISLIGHVTDLEVGDDNDDVRGS